MFVCNVSNRLYRYKAETLPTNKRRQVIQLQPIICVINTFNYGRYIIFQDLNVVPFNAMKVYLCIKAIFSDAFFFPQHRCSQHSMVPRDRFPHPSLTLFSIDLDFRFSLKPNRSRWSKRHPRWGGAGTIPCLLNIPNYLVFVQGRFQVDLYFLACKIAV